SQLTADRPLASRARPDPHYGPAMSHRAIVCAALLVASSAPAAEPFRPDPQSVRRFEAGYRYPQHGWAVLHIEGEPYERGVQHGRLMAKEIETYVAALSEHRG